MAPKPVDWSEEFAFYKKILIFLFIPAGILFLIGFMIQIYLNSKVDSNTSSKSETVTSSDPAQSAEAPDIQRNAILGGFDKSELISLETSRNQLYAFVSDYAGLVAGTMSALEVSTSCNSLEDSYDSIRQISSTSPYFEDLLDRAKDYLYESRSTCEYAFKKNRSEDLIDSAELAGIGVGFFDRLISEAESNQ